MAEIKTGNRLWHEWRCWAQVSPFFLLRHVLLDNNDVDPDFHGKDLELVVNRWAQGIKYQLIEYFRGALKTTCYTMGLSIWGILPSNAKDKEFAIRELRIPEEKWNQREGIRDQDATQLLVFETLDNACRKVGGIRTEFEDNGLFRCLFPEIAYTGEEKPWNNECLKIRRVHRNLKYDEGTFEAKGVGNALQSTHYDRIFEDDIVGEKGSKSEVVLEDTIGWHRRLSGLEQPGGRTTRFYVGNRWGFNDVNSYLRTEIDPATDRPRWRIYTRAVYEIDKDSGQTTLAWPQKFSWDVIRQKEIDYGDDFPAQMLNSPRPPGERQITTGGIHDHLRVQGGWLVCSCGNKYHVEHLYRYLLYDPHNAKGNARSKSCAAIAVVGLSADKHVFLLDYYQSKAAYGKVFEKIFEMNDKWLPDKMGYEDVGAQNMCEHYIREVERNPEHLKKHKLVRAIEPVGVGGKPSEIRIKDYLLPLIEGRGQVFSVRKGHRLLFDMLDTWPHSVPGHDYDLLSALALGPVLPWRFPMDEDLESLQQSAEREWMENINKPYTPAFSR